MSGSDRGGHTQTVAQGLLATSGIILAIAIAAFLAYSQGVYSERRDAAAHQHADSAKTSAGRTCAGLEPAAMFECVYEKVERGEETARAEQDLSAQQDMALWALLMVIVSAVTATIASVALWYVKGTLDETRAMTVEAQKTTAAAEDALRVTQDVAAAELRPWVVIEARITRFTTHAARVDVDYEVVFRNIGQTVATSVRVQGVHDFLGDRAADGIRARYASWEKENEPSGEALIPGEEIVAPGSHYLSLDMLPWTERSGKRCVYSTIIASVFYGSELDDRVHRTERSFIFGVPGEDWFDQRYLLEDSIAINPAELVRSPFVSGETT